MNLKSQYIYFNVFWKSYLLIIGTGFLLILYYLTNAQLNLIFLFKLPLAVMFFILILFHMKYKIHLTALSFLFLCFSVVGIFLSILHETLFSKEALTHIYMTMMPILAISFGYHFAKNYNDKFDYLMQKTMNMLFYINMSVLFLYYYCFYVIHKIYYFGFDSILPLVSMYFLSKKQYKLLIVTVLLVVFSGKRAPLIAILVPLFVVFLSNSKKISTKNVLLIIFVSIGLFFGLYFLYATGMLYRFELLFDLNDYDSLYVASSGRSSEIFSLFNYLADKPFSWFFGVGYGGKFEIISLFREGYFHHKQHYLHLAILTYLFIFGGVFLGLFLLIICNEMWQGRKLTNHFFFLAMLCTFVGSFFGAGIIIEPIFWFFLGAFSCINQYKFRIKISGALGNRKYKLA